MVRTRSQTRKYNEGKLNEKKPIEKKMSIIYCGRVIVKSPVSNGKYFYKSTGFCSKNPGTWFPCTGISKQFPANFPGNVNGWIMKPVCKVKIPWHLKVICIGSNIIERFDNLESMVISYKIGGGFWDSIGQDAIALKNFLENTPEYRKDHEEIIKKILNDSKLAINVDLKEAINLLKEN
jgi:hypothetical protein